MTTALHPPIRVALADDHTMFRRGIVRILETASAFEVVANIPNGEDLPSNGANGYMLKDADPEELLHAIEYVYKNSFYHSDLVSGRLISILQKGLEYSQINITGKEEKFLELCCTELTYKEIADKMGLSARTVEGYRDTLFEKLDVKSRTGLIIYAMKLGITSIAN